MADFTNTVLLFTADGLGSGPLELRQKLIRIYLVLLLENNKMPAVMCFYTEGVRLAVAGSPVLDLLTQIEARGVRLVLCSTYLAFFNLADSVKVGVVGGMADIQEAQRRAEKVITL